ncbi:MAG TPA: hypothetical protein VFJ15_08940 [Oleiagrimonas sp.]|nr:hypothetical protein [Oleiagrimonas sp.]
MNSGEIFVLCIIIIVSGVGLAKHYLRSQEQKPREDPEQRNRLDALENRVQTLERIVTDRGYDLKREFEKL